MIHDLLHRRRRTLVVAFVNAPFAVLVIHRTSAYYYCLSVFTPVFRATAKRCSLATDALFYCNASVACWQRVALLPSNVQFCRSLPVGNGAGVKHSIVPGGVIRLDRKLPFLDEQHLGLRERLASPVTSRPGHLEV